MTLSRMSAPVTLQILQRNRLTGQIYGRRQYEKTECDRFGFIFDKSEVLFPQNMHQSFIKTMYGCIETSRIVTELELCRPHSRVKYTGESKIHRRFV